MFRQFYLSDVNVTLATTKDAKQLYELNKKMLQIYYSLNEFSNFIVNPEYIVYKVVYKKNIIGYLLAHIKSNSVHICSFAVDDDYLRKGIGTKLLDKVTQFTKDIDFNILSLYVKTDNFNAIECYKKNGFTKQKIMKWYYGIGDDALKLHKLL